MTVHPGAGQVTIMAGGSTHHARASSPDELRRLARDETERGRRRGDERAAARGALYAQAADLWEREASGRASAAKEQRNRRAAATRAHNRDPFGFNSR